ncbi:hypothetical protein ABKV19_000718 [Rosa sericea]
MNNTDVRDGVAALSTQKAIVKKKKVCSQKKKLKAYDLSSFSEFLPEFVDSQEPAPTIDFKLILKEAEQLGRVLNHPAFQADPMAAIYEHLKNTQPVMAEQRKKRKKKMEVKTGNRINLRL